MQWIFLLGVASGAVLCWAAWMGVLPEHGWGKWITYLVSALVFTGFALGEDYGDTLPKTPSRKAPGPFAARLAFGSLVGALAATGIYEPVAGGILVGFAGALVGTLAGYALRVAAARRLGRDLPVALAESALAVVFAIWAIWNLHQGVLIDLKRGAV